MCHAVEVLKAPHTVHIIEYSIFTQKQKHLYAYFCSLFFDIEY